MKKIIIACDSFDKESYKSFLKRIQDSNVSLKVGMELFYTLGEDSVKLARDYGFDVFLDLKLHDIPSTVHKALKKIARLDVQMTNVHCAGGLEMLKASREAIDDINPKIKLIGVTQLTSTTQEVLSNQILIKKDLIHVVEDYSLMAFKENLDGVVSSALEVADIKRKTSESFLCVTPGIRILGDESHDQKRIMTPTQAIESGSDHLVIGRSITQASDPRATINNIIKGAL